MRILVETPLFLPYLGGMEILLGHYIRALHERGHDVLVVTGTGPQHLPVRGEWESIPIARLPFHRAIVRNDVALVARCRAELAGLKRDFQPDVVQANFGDPTILFHLLTRSIPNAPTVVSLHSPLMDQLVRPGTAVYQAIASATWVTACSGALAATARRLVPEAAERITTIHNGVPPPRRPPVPLPQDASTVLAIGRLAPEKGFDVALRAFVRVRHAVPTARFVLAGDGPERARLARRIADDGLEEAVTMLGEVAPERVAQLMSGATIVIVPSVCEEAFGLVALEAALQARPVVASDVGGLPEVVVDGETGVIVPPREPNALADAVIRLLRDPQRARALGRSARDAALRRFSLDRHVEAHEQLFRRVIGGAAGS